ncbi:MAG: EscN/YscN/HrcN family type III secretion system ATPase, partial [Bacillota bacterium]|nr:EscN/YscN/HrcN family type III secretion system ATPase [Bacillota bacterium]
VLSRRLAQENHFPAVDILESLSRLMPKVASDEELRWAGEARRILATYRDAQDLIHIGAYQEGRDPAIDRAVALRPGLLAFLRQSLEEPPGPETLAHVLGGDAT